MKKKSQYDVDYFIKKFKGIPRNKWTTHQFTDCKGRKCVMGHCTSISEVDSLCSLIVSKDYGVCAMVGINDGMNPRYPQKHPKTRVLAALIDLKRSIYE